MRTHDCTVHLIILGFIVSEVDALVRGCVSLVRAHDTLQSDRGLSSLPEIASKVEQYREELLHAVSSTTGR